MVNLSLAGATGLSLAGNWQTSRWARSGALLDLDFLADRYYFGGRYHATENAVLSACGGVRSGGAVTLGPWDVPDAPERVTNGDFADGLAGWSVYNGGLATIDSGGRCRFDGNGGAFPGMVRAVALSKGRAYRLRATVSDGHPLPGGHSMSLGSHPTLAGTVSLTIAGKLGGGMTLDEHRYGTFSAPADTAYLGVREIASPATGTAYYDDISVREVLPVAGFAQGGFSGFISGTTPPVSSGSKVVFQADDDAVEWPYRTPVEYNRVRLVWDASRHLRLIVTETDQNGAAEQANLDLGIIPVSTSFEVVFSVAPNAFRAALRGGPIQSDLSGDMPGLAVLRFGRGATGDIWGGAIHRASIIPYPLNVAGFLEAAAAPTSIVAWGDSLTAGGGAGVGHAYPSLAEQAFSPARSVSGQGVGGQTSTQIAARQGGVHLVVSVSGNQIPATGAVAVTGYSPDVLFDSGAHVGTLRGQLAGIRGTLATDAAGNWTFTRDSGGVVTGCPAGSVFMPELAFALRDRTAWFWLGRNGAATDRTIAQDIAAAVKFIGHGRYLVGAILPSASDGAAALATIAATNTQLAGTYGTRFVDLVATLQGLGNGSADDLADISAGLVPRSLRSDAVHLNDTGYGGVASAFVAATMAFGW